MHYRIWVLPPFILHLLDCRPSGLECASGRLWSWCVVTISVVRMIWLEGISVKYAFEAPRSLSTWLYFLNLDWRERRRFDQWPDSLRLRKSLSETGKFTAKIPEAISDRFHKPIWLNQYVLSSLLELLNAAYNRIMADTHALAMPWAIVQGRYSLELTKHQEETFQKFQFFF